MIKTIWNKTAGLLLGLLLFSSFLPVQAFAAETIQTDQPVSLMISATYAGNGLKGVSYRMYLVAAYSETSGLTRTDAFKACDVSMDPENLDGDTAKAAASYAEREKIAPDDAGTTDSGGRLSFPTSGRTMHPGIYLVVAEPLIKDESVYEISPLLISLPDYEASTHTLRYDASVNAKSAKTAIKTTIVPPKPSLQPETPTENRTPETPIGEEIIPVKPQTNEEKLPQTGLLWWPIPILISAGIACLLLGHYSKKQKSGKK